MSKYINETQNVRTSLKDIKFADEIDWNKLIRGETPENIKELCLDLCKDYLFGNWRQQTIDTIEVRRISGGLTNQLYYCAIIELSIDLTDCVPQEVVIRLYGPKHINNLVNDGNERLSDIIIGLMVSENKLGPKLYGLFENGEILHYYKHRSFKINEQNDPKLAEQLFRKLARVHAMDVPIKKTSHWLLGVYDSYCEIAIKDPKFTKLVEEYNCQTFKENDIKEEINWLKETILESKSPQVFSHVDFSGGNILVTEPNDEIVLCDFEYSMYGFRGFDFGRIIKEWGSVGERLKSEDVVKQFPNDTTLETLVSAYIEESVKIFGKKYSENRNNSLKQIIFEAKLFCLANYMSSIATAMKWTIEGKNQFFKDESIAMTIFDNGYQCYLNLKKEFTNQKLFDLKL